MATVPLTSVLGHLRRAVLRFDELSDAQLLALFIKQRDEAAFEVLVRRHGPMVLGVCRRMLGNEADAEDAFQATFLVLVRRAGSLTQRALVSNWLYGVAQRTALKAKSMNSIRRAKENEAAKSARAEVRAPDALEGLLDEALARLPDRYRLPLVLCELEGKSLKEAAEAMGCPQGTVASRLARGRTMLARRMSRNGLTVSGAVLAGVLSQSAASACVPGPLVVTTIKAAGAMAAGQAATAGVISAHVLALTEGVLKAMLHSKLKVAAVMLVLIAVIGWGVGNSAYPQALPPTGARSAPQAESTQREGRPKWEYKALTRTAVEKLAQERAQNKLTDGLNVLGADGWELVGIDQAGMAQGMTGGFGGFGGGGFGIGGGGGGFPGGGFAGGAPGGGPPGGGGPAQPGLPAGGGAGAGPGNPGLPAAGAGGQGPRGGGMFGSGSMPGSTYVFKRPR
jgi:RNA polymerase sigma factor (sigma-70 family)